ncbi:hypothetical protein AAG747_14050 [Rapidithrix thailandica]|uniref:Uncharacterized protein n=1 Tax=Rapidithrix thailandica TaxID=413964 RepID=A0AAW9RVY1_9BACT
MIPQLKKPSKGGRLKVSRSKQELLKILEKNLSLESLEILAEKSRLPGINLLIKANKNLL